MQINYRHSKKNPYHFLLPNSGSKYDRLFAKAYDRRIQIIDFNDFEVIRCFIMVRFLFICKLVAAITKNITNSETKHAKMKNEVSTAMFSWSTNTFQTFLK